MSKFLSICDPEQEENRSDGYQNPLYNDWKEKCLKTIVSTYKNDYSWIFQEVREENKPKELSSEEVVTIQSTQTGNSNSFSPGTVGGIGAGAAAGGAGLAVVVPIAVKSLIKFFTTL